MKLYLRVLATLYLVGAILHVGDLLGIRLNFSEMNSVWKTWIIYLTIGDSVAAIGLWFQKKWGELAFQLIAYSQLIAYLGFRSTFGDQTELIIFHTVSLSVFYYLKYKVKPTE